MKISHITPAEEWAFKYVVENVASGMPEHENVVNCLDGSADVKHVLTPNAFRFSPGDSRTVLHLDGNRWFENFLKEEGGK